jgi:protein-S-isoprenylcysteine O-methyltransferase Ste14
VSQQATFRIIFAALFLILFGVVGTYRRKASAGRRIDYSDEGLLMLIALRLGGLFLWGFCFLYIIYPRPLGWSFIEVPYWLRWVGAAVVLVLIPFVVSAQQALGRNVSPTVITHEDHELITSGPYRWIRNPLYTAGGLIFTGLGLVAASWFLIGGAVLALVLVRLRLPKEEAQLEDRFGQEYRDYAGRTGRFLPSWSR